MLTPLLSMMFNSRGMTYETDNETAKIIQFYSACSWRAWRTACASLRGWWPRTSSNQSKHCTGISPLWLVCRIA